MNIVIIGAIIGIIIWAFGIILDGCILCWKESVASRAFAILYSSFIIFVLGLIFSIPAIPTPISDVVTVYETPTSILRTNNLTIITHVNGDGCVISGQSFIDAATYNSTNIRVKVVSGKNFYGCEVGKFYKVVIE